MKKYSLILFFIIINIIFVNNANGYTCVYDYKTEKGLAQVKYEFSVEFTIDTTSKTIKFPDGLFDVEVYFLDKLESSSYTEEYIVDSLDGGCTNNIVVCYFSTEAGYAYGIFYNESNLYNLGWEKVLGSSIYKLGEEYNYGSLDKSWCTISPFNADQSTGKVKASNFGCDILDTFSDGLQDLGCEDKENKCSIEEQNKYNKKKKQIKTFCQSVFEHANYGVSPCLDRCLEIENQLVEDKENNLLNCGFSERLIHWIANIIRWVKYIIPIVVIVLGILDFMKAMSADKEDEMKKAQQRFIRRLIAAALIFIAPFIIEFILNKLGFNANGCGIINL